MPFRLEAPRFWTLPPSGLANVLSPLGWVYGAIAGRRMQQSGRKAPLPVICVGNFVAGGQGKTPTVIALAKVARDLGLNPLFLTRGFGGALKGPVLVDPQTMTAHDVGDEALLLAAHGATVVSAKRADVIASGLCQGYDLILMDDGFQSPGLMKDRSIIVTDGATGIGNGRMIPAGPLRAPLGLQLSKTDLLLVIQDAERGISGAQELIAGAENAGVAIGYARLKPADISALMGRPLLAYAGIGRPAKFYSTLRAAGLDVAQTQDFPDHHVFTADDANNLLGRAARNTLTLITTEKDFARMAASHGEVATLRNQSRILAVNLELEAHVLFENLLRF